MSRWRPGAADVEALLASRALDVVTPSGDLAERLLKEAAAHLESADVTTPRDPVGAFQLAYDGARKSAAALLAAQGLRGTTAGGHRAIAAAASGQFGGAFKGLDRMRRTRHAAEYPDLGTPSTTEADSRHAIAQGRAMRDAAQQILASGQLGVFAE